jgi:hypothetical protein
MVGPDIALLEGVEMNAAPRAHLARHFVIVPAIPIHDDRVDLVALDELIQEVRPMINARSVADAASGLE